MANGRVVQVIGTVVDVEFDQDSLPEVFNGLNITMDDGSPLVLEVQKHLGNNWVRCLAMGPTEGLRRGIEVVDTGDPISVPVGDQTLGSMFDVLGYPIDEKGGVSATSSILPDLTLLRTRAATINSCVDSLIFTPPPLPIEP